MYQFSRSLFVLSVGLGLSPSHLNAQQLSQPASVLPWKPAKVETQLALKSPITASESDSPRWLTEQAKPLTTQQAKAKALPMVETEQFADLGPLDDDPTAQPLQRVRPNRTGRTNAVRPFNLFRALGIQASRSGNRR